MENEALYPFGYGLSYTKFKYCDLKIEKDTIHVGESIKLTAIVKNIGNYESDETAELYLKDVEASVEIAKWQLRGVKVLHLKPGAQEEINFELTPKHMSLINNQGQRILEPGVFEVFVGGSQPDERSYKLTGCEVLKGNFKVLGESIELEY